ncbi:MAG: hypothetical protein NTW30_04375 [Candidatus Aenigmarchaeota archaeon]|nr:hypothetical protein [Candidatus Aenigmarchaeota archaeon]
MSIEVEVTDVKTSDDSDLRTTTVKLAKEPIKTPVKAIETNDFFKDTHFQNNLSNLSEHFISFNEYSLKTYYTDKKTTLKKSKAFEKHKKRLDDNTTSITIVEYKNKEPKNENKETIPKIPDDEEIKRLINAAYSLSDITAIPSIPRVVRQINLENFTDFIEYLQKCYDNIQIRNKKKIIGYIPMVAPAFAEELIDFYLRKLGINAFYADFDGTTLNSNAPIIDAIKRKLSQEGYEEKHFLHFVNISYGKAINDVGVLTAKDLLAYGHGFDSFGGIHCPAKRGKQFYEWLKKQKNIKANTTRILNKEDYGYYKYSEEDIQIESIYPNDALFGLNEINGKTSFSTKKRYFGIVNLQQQALESINLRRIVKEKSDKTIEYFETKKNVKQEDIKLLKRSKK